MGPTGPSNHTTPAEATLNWQSENAVAQNKALNAIISQQQDFAKSQEILTSRVHSLENIIYEVRSKILGLHNELLQIAHSSPTPQPPRSLIQKESEMKFLKAQLTDLERQHKQQKVSTLVDDPWRLPSTPFVNSSFDPQPLPSSPFSQTSPSMNLWSTEQTRIKARARKASSGKSTSSDSTNRKPSTNKTNNTSTSDSKPIQDDSLMMANTNPISSLLQSISINSQIPMVAPIITSFSDEESVTVSEDDITSHDELESTETFEHLFMNEEEPTERVDSDLEDANSQAAPQNKNASQNTDSKQQFTFDDVPPSKWRERYVEMLTWCSAELQYYDIDMVIKRFLTRCQGRIRDWYLSLGEYRQIQIQKLGSPEEFMHVIHNEFIGNPVEHTFRAREEFLKMKCCSFQPKDLEKHYNRMSERFYCLHGVDDVNLKQVFLNSFPESLSNEAYRALENKNSTVAQASLGELYQLILNALSKLCNQKRFLVEFERTGKCLGSACNDKHLKIKCKDESSCDCSSDPKKSYKKSSDFYFPAKKSYHKKDGSKREWKFLSRKPDRNRNTDRCFVCNKKGHFAKDCRQKKKTQALLQAINNIEPVDISDLEYLYSLDDEPGEKTICSIVYPKSDDSDTSDSETDNEIRPFFLIEGWPSKENQQTRFTRKLRHSPKEVTLQKQSPIPKKDSIALPDKVSQAEKKIQTTDVISLFKIPTPLDKSTKKVRKRSGYKRNTLHVLAAKKEIKNLLCFNLLTKMDMSPFLKIWESKKEKALSQYTNTFEESNTYLLPRREGYKKTNTYNALTIPTMFKMYDANSSSSSKTVLPQQKSKEKNIPDEIRIATQALNDKSLRNYKTFLTITLRNHGLFMKGIRFHPDYPFLNVLQISNLYQLPKEASCFLWFLLKSFTIAMSFNSSKLLTYLLKYHSGFLTDTENQTLNFLQWFYPAQKWTHLMSTSPKKHCIILLHNPSSNIQEGQTGFYKSPLISVHAWYDVNPSSFYFKLNYHEEWLIIRKALATENNVLIKDIPCNIFKDKDVWNEEDLQAKEWEEAIVEYFNTNSFSKHVWNTSMPTTDKQDTKEEDPYQTQIIVGMPYFPEEPPSV